MKKTEDKWSTRTQTHNRVPRWNRLCSTMFHPCQNPCYKTSDCSFGLYNAQMLPCERAQEKPRALIFLILNNCGTWSLPSHESCYYLLIKHPNTHFFSTVSSHLWLERGVCSLPDELLDDFMPLISSPSIPFVSFIAPAKHVKGHEWPFIYLFSEHA